MFSLARGFSSVGNEKYDDSIDSAFVPSGLLTPYPSAYQKKGNTIWSFGNELVLRFQSLPCTKCFLRPVSSLISLTQFSTDSSILLCFSKKFLNTNFKGNCLKVLLPFVKTSDTWLLRVTCLGLQIYLFFSKNVRNR